MSTLTEVKELLLEQEQVVNENEIVLFNAVSYTHLPSPRDPKTSRMPSSA